MDRKTILITGTSSGIGNETAKYFVERGWNVAATVRRKKDFFFGKDQHNAKHFITDITSGQQCKQVINDVITTFGRLDVLVNNAGIAVMGAFEETGTKSIDKQFATNLFGPIHLTKYVLPNFRKQRSGLILTVSTIAGRIGVPFYSLHAAGKFAIEGFFESLRFELFPFNVRVKIIEPGSYRSRILDNGSAFERAKRIPDYQPFLDKHEEELRNYEVRRRDPIEVAQTIWAAVHDTSSQLRYIVGPDAINIHKMRKELTDEELFSLMGKNFQPSV